MFALLNTFAGVNQNIIHIMNRLIIILSASTMAAEALEVVYDMRWMMAFIIILIITDFWFGVSESRKKKVQLRLSRAGRRTCNKLIDYTAYLFFGAMVGKAILEPLSIASHTTTAAIALSLACIWEMDSIINHILTLHNVNGRFSLFRLAVSIIKKKDKDVGEAIEEVKNEEERV